MAGRDTERQAETPGAGKSPRFDRYGRIGLALAVMWLAAWITLALISGESADGSRPGTLLFTLGAALPPGLIWLGVQNARTRNRLRRDIARLGRDIATLRERSATAPQNDTAALAAELIPILGEMADSQSRTDTALATLSATLETLLDRVETPPAATPAPPPDVPASRPDDQPSLALSDQAEPIETPLTSADFIAALQFPEDADDREGLRALRHALQHRQAAQLIQAAQDILTLLAQDSIYMDDLHHDRAATDIWRLFARGERGRVINGLGGVRERSALGRVAARMRSDTIFRDATHHFLRRFDHTFSAFEATASDDEIAHLAETRTARAFMLLGRVAGTFD